MARYDAIVIGGGLVGTATAYHLASSGARTLLIDRADTGRATDAGAGILSPETNTRDPEAWFDLATAAVAYYSTLIPQLQAEQEHDTGYANCGSLLVAVTEDEEPAFDDAKQSIFSRQNRLGQSGSEDLTEISSVAAMELHPALAPVYGAILNRRAARVDGRMLNLALRTAALNRGLTVKPANVERMLVEEKVVRGVVTDDETEKADAVCIAGGAWSESFGVQLGIELPVSPQRGQIIHLGLDRDTSTWPIVSAFHGHYMVPWPDNRVVAGATRETGSGFQSQTSAAGVTEVLSEALRVAPGLADAVVKEIRVGLRPVTPDGLPILGCVPGIAGAFLATGHGPTGLTLGPYSGELVAEMMLGNEPSANLSAFQVSRFQG